jgi:peptide methionine sulfoxide reductase msrA/msrB
MDFVYNRKELYETAVFAGGCFWCIEAAFDDLEGVIEAVSGYTGGDTKSPSYTEVCTGKTGHYEAVKITFDPLRISYLDLLDVFFGQIDPSDKGGQFADRGPQYRTAVFFSGREQEKIAVNYIEVLKKSGSYGKIETQVLPAKEFYPAEEHHQKYAACNKAHYESYAYGSGRKKYISSLPAEKKYIRPSDDEIRNKLTKIQYAVTQRKKTDRPFDNEYYGNHEEGIYVDIVSGEPLFSSVDKYDSGSGWPSFTKPLAPMDIVYLRDSLMLEERTEIVSRYAGSHLGHVFTDGPGRTGLRYCLNSSSMRFVPKKSMQEQGYGKYMYLFAK